MRKLSSAILVICMFLLTALLPKQVVEAATGDKFTNFYANYEFGRDTSVTIIDNYVYFMANMSGATPTEYACRLNLDNKSDGYKPIKFLPIAIMRTAYTVVDKKIYHFGGDISVGSEPLQVTNKVHIYNAKTNSWSYGASMPTARAGAEAIAVGNKIYVIGGFTNDQQALNNVEVYDTKTNTWTTETPAPYTLKWPGGDAYNNKIYIVDSNHTLVYDTISKSWSELAKPLTNAIRAGVICIDGKLYGTLASYAKDLHVYDIKTDTWTKEADVMPQCVEGGSPIVYKDKLYIVTEEYLVYREIDRTPPVNYQLGVTIQIGEDLQLSISEGTSDNLIMHWTSSSAAIATVDGKGKVTGIGQGLATITVNLNDGTKQSLLVRVEEQTDNLAPVISLVDVTGMKATIQATDNVAVTQYSISKSKEVIGSWQKSNVFDELIEGNYFAFAKDAAGNISEAYAFVIAHPEPDGDTEAPIVTGVQWNGTSVQITAKDNVGVTKHGISKTKNLADITWKISNSFVNIEENVGYYAFAMDESGNISKPYMFLRDTQEPVITSVDKGEGGIVVTATDNLEVTKYCISESYTIDEDFWQTSNVFTNLMPGRKYYIFAADVAGNISDVYVYTAVDSEPPVVTDVFISSSGATIKARDNMGVAKYGISKSTDASAITWKLSDTFTKIDEDVQYYAFAIDAEGNISEPFPFVKISASNTLEEAKGELTEE